MSLSLFMALPAPLKVAVILMGGWFFVGFRVQQNEVNELMQEQAGDAAAAEELRVVPPARAIPVEPAKPGQADQVQQALELVLEADGSFQMNGKAISEADLKAALKKIAAKTPQRRVVIKADSKTTHQKVISTLNLCKGAGLVNISFATKPAGQ